MFYRPKWTCGRYNKKEQVAIFYNLIAGVSYFFEDYSAMVVGEILSVKRDCSFSPFQIAEKLDIAKESLAPFLEQLEELGLVSSIPPTDRIVADYRKRTSEYNCNQQRIIRSTQDKLPYAISNAEQLYTERVGGITSAMFELTYRCSEKCIHCYNEGASRNDNEKSTRGNRDELTLEDYKHLIDDLYDQGLIKVCLTGGDPFSKSFVWEIIDYLFQKGIAFDIFTNGQSIVKDIPKLADYYPRLVGISIYSGIAEVHDYITRVSGSWQRSMKVLSLLSELAVPTNIKCCIMKPNIKSYYMIADIASKYGAVPQFEINLTDSIDGDKCVSKYLRLDPYQLEIVLRDDNIPLYVGKEAPNFGGQEKNMEIAPCGAGENTLCVTPEGLVIPCCAFHTLFGDLKTQNVKDIIKNSAERKYWIGLSLKQYAECGRYDFCAYCNLCPGNNFVEHGTPLKASEVNCHLAKVRYELAQKMKVGYDPLNGKTLKERLLELPDYTPMNIRRELSQNYSDTRLKVGG